MNAFGNKHKQSSKFHRSFQVTDETAEVLMRANYKCALRGPIFVKGKGIITTYFARTPFDDKKSNEPRIAENYQRL